MTTIRPIRVPIVVSFIVQIYKKCIYSESLCALIKNTKKQYYELLKNVNAMCYDRTKGYGRYLCTINPDEIFIGYFRLRVQEYNKLLHVQYVSIYLRVLV